MQGVGSIVSNEAVELPSVQGIDLSVRDTVCDTADGGAEVGAVVRSVELLGWETLDDVDAPDLEGLNNSSKRQEGNLVSHVDIEYSIKYSSELLGS